jgi:hypothetical protein
VVTTYRGEEHHWPRRRGAAVAAKGSTGRATGSTSARRTREAGVRTSELGFAVLMRVLRDLD